MSEQTSGATIPGAQPAGGATKPTPFEQIALLLQGGGALGAYQAGVYHALAENGLHPDWVAGISIGAINSAIIAGNAPEKRVERLREFWESVSASPLGLPNFTALDLPGQFGRQFINQAQATNILLFGAPNFFVPRVPPPALWPPGSVAKASYYDNGPLRATLARLVDFDRINDGGMRFSVGAVDVGLGNFTYFEFDHSQDPCRPRHRQRLSAAGILRRPRSTGGITGTAGSSPTRRCNGCSTACRGATRSPSRSTCGARAAICRRI